jgi:uncharacterized membrane protein YfcA
MTAAVAVEAALLTAIVFMAFTTQAVTGFGAVILSLSVGAFVLPISVLLPVLVVLSTALNSVYFVRDRAEIDSRVFGQRILPWMGGGMLIGLAVGTRVDASGLTRGFGVFVGLLAAWQLVHQARSAHRHVSSSTIGATMWLVAAGAVHGLVAAGGPLLVHAVQREGLTPRTFRATMLTVWLTLNIGILAVWFGQGRLTTEVAGWVFVSAPAVACAVLVGDRLHDRLDPKRFRVAVYVVLLFAGALLAMR